MKRFPAAALFLAITIAVFAFPAAAARRGLEGVVRARQQSAQALAGKGQWDAAFQALAAARDEINADRRIASTPARRPLSPALRKEAKAINVWLASKTKGRKAGEPMPAAVATEYRRRQSALRKKIANSTPSKQSDMSGRQAALRYGLLLAELDDTAAALHQRKGDASEAKDRRLEAGRRRLAVYAVAGKKAEADAWAARLIKSGGGDPSTLADVAEYHQGARRFGPAIGLWQQAIRLREKDPSSSAALETQVYHRQLAYCYDRLGRKAERDAARAAAARLEAAHASQRRPR